MSVRRAAAPVVALAVWTGLVGVAPAVAATDPDALWYLTETGVEEVHARTTGEGITIAVIDGPVNPAAPDLVGANLVVRPSFCHSQDGVTPSETSDRPDADHATGTVALLIGTGAGVNGQPGIRGVAPGATVLSYAMLPPNWETSSGGERLCYDADGAPNGRFLAQSIDDAVAQGADIISMSTGGAWSAEDGAAVARAYAAGVVVVAAPDNDGSSATWPGLGNGVVMVEMTDSAMQLDAEGDTTSHPYLGVVAPGADVRWYDASDGLWDSYELASGTSIATPWTAGVLALAWSLHPEATGNQMIQALIHTTAVDPGFGHDDQWGYGPVAVRKLVEADPTQYPDENPFLRPVDVTEDADGMPIIPTTQEVLDAVAAASGAPVASASPSPSASGPAPSAEARPEGEEPKPEAGAEAGAGAAVPIAIGLGAAALLAAVVVLLRRRSGTTTATAGAPSSQSTPSTQSTQSTVPAARKEP